MILDVSLLFITVKLAGSFVVILVAARYSGKCDRKRGTANPARSTKIMHVHNKNPSSQYPASAHVLLVGMDEDD